MIMQSTTITTTKTDDKMNKRTKNITLNTSVEPDNFFILKMQDLILL